ncbi:MAG: prolyl oligopeptidase family serine peptidase [Bacteroidales bacterium]|nr:prolyl oligopeptidase family serine peptidase [Bacteroidales bacterium]
MRLFFTVILLCHISFLTAQDQHILKSDFIPGDDTIWVFKPLSFDSAVIYPAVYLLHGRTGDYRSWNKLINLQGYAEKYQFIIICPDGFSDSYYLNSALDPAWQFESFFTEVLYPKMLASYPIDQNKIFITGLSMGGSGAMYLFLKHPMLFLSAGSTGGVMDLNHSSSKQTSLTRLLGDYDTNRLLFNSHSPVNLLQNIQGSDKQIFFDCGTEDYLYECNNAYRKRCDELNIKATYISRPGKHERSYWLKSIRCHFDFFKTLIEE